MGTVVTPLHAGQQATSTRTFTQSDFDRFAALSGDDNPIHVDPAFSARTRFGRTVAHGMFLYSLVGSVLSTRLPGPGVLQVEQELKFPTATPAGEEVAVRVEVTDLEPATGLAVLNTVVLRPNGQPGLQGRTRVLLPTAAFPPPSAASGSQSPDPESRLPDLRIPTPDASPFKGFELGQRAQAHHTFTTADLAEYADLTGDTNPLFTDDDYTRARGLQGPVLPGALLGGLFSYLLGTELPGRGTNYLKQRLHFPSPAYVGQPILASVEIVRIRSEKQLVNLNTVCADSAGHVVCHGEALVLVSDV